jgi:hypothetical protein
MSILSDIIDRIIQLDQRREQITRSLYVDFVQPLVSDLDTLHKDYLAAFRKYTDRLLSGGDLDKALLDEIAADSLFSEDLRAKVRAAVDEHVDARISALINAIKTYLSLVTLNPLQQWYSTEDLFVGESYEEDRECLLAGDGPLPDSDHRIFLEIQRTMPRVTNIGRLHLHRGLRDLLAVEGMEPDVRTDLAVLLIEGIVRELQARRSVVARAHEQVRQSLLRAS